MFFPHKFSTDFPRSFGYINLPHSESCVCFIFCFLTLVLQESSVSKPAFVHLNMVRLFASGTLFLSGLSFFP
jgi:hypothetical protein